MPGPKTHDIFYHQLKNHLSPRTLQTLPHYDDYSIFAQGHDFLIYRDFYKICKEKQLSSNVDSSVLLQEHQFSEFVYQYLKCAQLSGAIEDEQVRLFLGPGYIMHHILDAYTHPFIIYYAGDHERDKRNKTWQHGIVENLIDLYMMVKIEEIKPERYPVYKDFHFDRENIREALIATLDESLETTYGIQNGGLLFRTAIPQVELFMRTLKFDPIGWKRVLFDACDPILKGTSSFSYHRDYRDVQKFLNEEHEIWLNPMDGTNSSTESFMDLYNKALDEGAKMVDQIEALAHQSRFTRDDVYDIIPNIASTHGLECGQKLKIINKKSWK